MHQIRYFLAVCEKQNFTQAAKINFVSQPSLTLAIQKLEKELGGPLFIRGRGRCELTPLGRLIEPNLRKIYQYAAITKEEAVHFNLLEKVPLRIGLMQSIGARRFMPFLSGYRNEYPNTDLELIICREDALLKEMQSGLVDLVISAPDKLSSAHFNFKLLYEERYVVAFKKDHRFNQLEEIDLAAIQSEPYLDRLHCELRETLKTVCNNREIKLYAAYRSNNDDSIIQMVRAGMGIALIPEYTIPPNADDLGYKYLRNPPISRKVYAIYAKPNSKNIEFDLLLNGLAGGLSN